MNRTLNQIIGPLLHRIQQALRLMVGIPDYENYVAHFRARHSTEPLMTYEEFFQERQRRRYEGSQNGKCC